MSYTIYEKVYLPGENEEAVKSIVPIESFEHYLLARNRVFEIKDLAPMREVWIEEGI